VTDKCHIEEFDPPERIILNLEDFINDLEHAFDSLMKDIREKDNIFESAKNRFNEIGLIRYIRTKSR
jgi:hypothetical protein